MTIVSTVSIPQPLERIQQIEAENPAVMESIMSAAARYMTGHRRLATDGAVLDVDEFASRETYDAFVAEAADALREYARLASGSSDSLDTLYTVVAD